MQIDVGISSKRSDQLTLIPFLEILKQSLSIKFKNVIADADYESEQNYVYLEIYCENTYIKLASYETSKKRSFKNNVSKRENMGYDASTD